MEVRRRVRLALEHVPVIMDEERFIGQSFACEPSAAALRRLKISEPVAQTLGKGAQLPLLDMEEAARTFGGIKQKAESTGEVCDASGQPGEGNRDESDDHLNAEDYRLVQDAGERADMTPADARYSISPGLERAYGTWPAAVVDGLLHPASKVRMQSP